MAVKKSYNRYFIIFQEEDRGFGIAIDKQPTGYTKIENRNGKCKITVYAQNLLKERGPYFCCLIDSTKDPLVVARLGALNIDEAGRGETWWEYKEDDIADTLVPFDRFNIASIITEDQRINAPLAGYIGKDKIAWKERMPLVSKVNAENKMDKVVNNEESVQAPQEKLEEVEMKVPIEEKDTELDEEAKQFKEYEEGLQNINDSDKVDKNSKKEIDKEKTDINSEKKDIDNEEDKNKGKRHVKTKEKDNNKDKENIKSVENLKEDNIKENKIKESKDIKIEEKNQDKKKIYDTEGSNELLKTAEVSDEKYERENDFFNERSKEQEIRNIHERPFATMFHDILEDFEEEKDISDGLEDVRWWRVPLNDELSIGENIYYPYYCAIYHLKMVYPYINYIKYFNKLGFYHFGIKYDSNGEVRYVLYGIEGGNMPETQPYMGMTGFIRWVKMKNSDRGMWIMYYNPHTGCIMIPKKR